MIGQNKKKKQGQRDWLVKLKVFCETFRNNRLHDINNYNYELRIDTLQPMGLKINEINPFSDTYGVDLIDAEQPETRSTPQDNNYIYKAKPIGMVKNSFEFSKKTCNQNILIQNSFSESSESLNSTFDELVEMYHIYVPDNKVSSLKTICVQICKDQNGSRYIQEKLDIWDETHIELFFNQILSYTRELSTNLFGNYVLQKLLTKLNKAQIDSMCLEFTNYITEISLNMFGCRVIQTLIDVCDDFPIDEILADFDKFILNPFGNHVVQKCLTNQNNSQGIIDKITKNAVEYSKEKYGCRIIQSVMQIMPPEDVTDLSLKLISNAYELLRHKFGNYVIQIIIQNPTYKDMLNDLVISHCKEMSMCKYSSNIVEKYVNTVDQKKINMFYDSFNTEVNGEIFILTLLKDGCGNYIIQTLYNRATTKQKSTIKQICHTNMKELKKLPYYKTLQIKLQLNDK